MSTRATELALEQAGLIGRGSANQRRNWYRLWLLNPGSTGPVSEFATMLTEKHTNNITGTTYVQMMPHTTAVNTGLFFGIAAVALSPHPVPVPQAARRLVTHGKRFVTDIKQ